MYPLSILLCIKVYARVQQGQGKIALITKNGA